MGEKIKIKDIEGDSDALASFFTTSDCSLGDYLDAYKKPKINGYIFISEVIIFIIISIILWIIPSDKEICKKIFTILSFTFAGITTLFIHLYWKNVIATIIGGFFSICIFMMVMDAMTPKEAGQTISNSMEQIQK